MIMQQYKPSLCQVILYASQVSQIIVFKPEYLIHKIWMRELLQYNLCKCALDIIHPISSSPFSTSSPFATQLQQERVPIKPCWSSNYKAICAQGT